MATLTGKITDVTGRAPDSISSITVKAPSVRIGGPGVIVSSPATVNFNRSTGSVTISGLAGGLAWLHLEGDGWADSIPLAVAEGMISLVEAIANAAGAPGMTDYVRLLAKLELAVDEVAQDAMDAAAQNIVWAKPAVSDADATRTPGAYRATSATTGTPSEANHTSGVLEILPSGAGSVYQRFTTWGPNPEVWVRASRNDTEWHSWQHVADKVAEIAEDLLDGRWGKNNIAEGENVNDIISPGIYSSPSSTNTQTLVNIPAGISAPILLEVKTTNLNRAEQTLTVLTNPGISSASYTRQSNAGATAWGDWQQFDRDIVEEWVAGANWNKGNLIAAQVGTVDNAPDGFSTIGSVNQARALESPFEAATVLGTFRFSGVAYQIGIARVDLKMRLVGRFYSASGWREWQDFTGFDSSGGTPVSQQSAPRPGSGFKTVPVAVTMGNSGTTHLATTGSYRFPLLNNAPITRWRLCATTRRPRQGDLSGADITLNKVAYGEHATNGAFVDTPTVVAENINIPADGSVIKLPWVSGEFGAGVERLISISYTSNNDIGPLSLHGYCFDMGTSDAAEQAATGTAKGSGPLDMWIEAETYATTPVIAAIGDSTTASSGATRTTYDGWLNVYCREKSALPVHYAAAGDTALNWMLNPEGYKATRWLDLDAPDAIIYNLGNNDVGGGSGLEVIQQHVAGMMPILEKIAPNIYAATLKPRTGQDPAQVQVRQSYNQWLLQERDFFRDVFDFYAATVDVDGESIRPEFNSGDDTHLNTAGYVALAGSITRPVTAPPVMYQSA